jgi:hypothetical protein
MNFGMSIKDGDFEVWKEDQCPDTNSVLVVALIKSNGRNLIRIIIIRDLDYVVTPSTDQVF